MHDDNFINDKESQLRQQLSSLTVIDHGVKIAASPEYVYEHMYAAVVNTDSNKNLLSHCPHESIANLSVIAKSDIGDGRSILVTDDFTQLLRLSAEEIIEHAKANTLHEGYTCSNLAQTVNEMIAQEFTAGNPDLLPPVIVAGGTGKCYSFLDHGLIADGMSKTSVFGESNTSYRSDRNNQMQELTKKLEDGIRELQSSDKYKHYLNVMGRFHHYSVNNCLLIAMQRPDAVQVAGYAAWEKNFQRHVKRGEKGIRIIAPAPYTVPKERVKCDPVTKKPILDKHGNAETEIVDVLVENYKAATVFDVSQTEGKELPEITYELNSNVGNYEELISAIRKISPVPIEFLDMPSSACKGYYNQFDKNIVVRLGMGESQTIKTMLHELSHAMLHDKDIGSQKEQPLDRRTKEVEAESVAYVVCQHYGIDTSDYSFGYVSGWCANSELSELKESLNIIQKTAANIIDGIQEQLREQEQKKSETLDQCSSISHDAAAPPTNEQHIRCRVRR